MAICEQRVLNKDFQEAYGEDGESGTEECNSDDSEDDPSYDILEETHSRFSNLSLKKSKSRNSKVIDSFSEGELDDVEIKVPGLNEKDEKSFEKVEKIIQAGWLEKLKVEQCKLYLRKNGLRLTGNKDVLIERIREHLGVIDGGGEMKYPISSFVLNCKGDACTGDVVMFEQNVYEMYNIASRSATGPPCGTRIVAGRIVKESYGAAKQQHTFTIEVLWSKGVKPLPPLHPLLIKGRNLYRLKTMRQRWADEEERRKVLLEKHSRGSLARSNRETRFQEKETRKMLKGQRITKKESSTIQEQNRQPLPDPVKSNFSRQPIVQSQQQQQPIESTNLQEQFTQFHQHKSAIPQNIILTEIHEQNKTQPQHCISQNSIKYQNSNITEEWRNEVENLQRTGFPIANRQHHFPCTNGSSHPITNESLDRSLHKQPSSLNSPPRSPLHPFCGKERQFHVQKYPSDNGSLDSLLQRQPLTSLNLPRSQRHHFAADHGSSHVQSYRQGPMQWQVCRFYAQGRCYYGDNCKYLHEYQERREERWPQGYSDHYRN